MSKHDDKKEKPFYVYRENKGYYYGEGAGPAKVGKPVDWKLNKEEKNEQD